MRAAIPRTIRTERDLSEVVEFYSGVDEFVFDTETVGKRRLHHKVNRVTWLGLCHGTRVDVIPIGHPKGELVRDTYSERVPWWDDNDLTKRGKPRKKWKTIRHPAVFTDPPEQLWAEDVWPALKPVFFSDAVKIGHNLKFDLLTVAKYFDGTPPPPPYGDTQLLARILDTTRSAKLKDITKQLWDHDYDQEDIAKPDKWGENGIEAHAFSKAARYTGLDVRYTWLIWEQFRRLLEKRGDANLTRLEMDVLESLLPGALLGMPVDEAAMRELGHRLTRDHQEIEQKIFAASGEVWDLNSTPQKQRFVYEIRGHEPEVYTDKSCQDHTEGDHHDGCTPSTSAGVLESYAQRDDAVAALLEYANVQKLRSTYSGAINPDGSYVLNKQGLPIAGMLDFIVDGRVHPNLNQYGADTNRLSSSSPNLQNIPSRSEDERAKALRKMFIADPGFSLVVADYCVAPETLVAMTDMTWKPAGEVEVGDEVLGFPESVGEGYGRSGSLYERTKVVSSKRVTRPCYRVHTSRGEVVSSAEHRWLARRAPKPGVARAWTRTDELQVGSSISYWVEPWEYEDSTESGYAAGFLDGEGYLSETGDLGWGQKPGPVLDKFNDILRRRGFDIRLSSVDKVSGVEKWRVAGPGGAARVIGWCRPVRLLAKSPRVWEGRRTWTKTGTPAIVEKIEYLGEQETVALGTGTKTFIANGFLSHNSQIEYRVLAYLSEDPTLIEAFLEGWDPHAATMALLLDKPIDEVTKQERDAGKGTNFGQVYGAGAATIAKSAGVSITRAKWIKKEYEVRFPKVTAWKKDVVNEARNQRPQPYVKTLLGHRRWLPGLWSSDDKRRFSAERQAVNTAVQGSAADIIKVAMVKLHRVLPEGSTMLLQVHDELIVQAPKERAEEVRTLVQETMESVSLLGRVPLEAEAHIGESWSDAK